jgi:PAS domain S-box-containing protein
LRHRSGPPRSATPIAFRANAHLLPAALEYARESFLLTDAELDQPGPRIVYANRAFTELTGWAVEEVLGQSPRILQGPRTDRRVIERLRSDLLAGRVFEGETTNYRKDGTEFTMAWYVTPIADPHGQVTHYLGVQHDVTEQRRLETIAATLALGDQLGAAFVGLRHELANPVNALKAAITLLRERGDELGVDEREAYLAQMHAAIGRAQHLLRSMQGFIASSRLEITRLDVAELVHALHRFLTPELERRGVQLRVDVEAETVALGDATAVHQVLHNLVLNAADAIAATRASIRIGARARDGRVWLTVEDDGPGMNAELLARARLPFATTKPDGSGLGLAIVDRLVARLGGVFVLESTRGVGTRASFDLPVAGAVSE